MIRDLTRAKDAGKNREEAVSKEWPQCRIGRIAFGVFIHRGKMRKGVGYPNPAPSRVEGVEPSRLCRVQGRGIARLAKLRGCFLQALLDPCVSLQGDAEKGAP